MRSRRYVLTRGLVLMLALGAALAFPGAGRLAAASPAPPTAAAFISSLSEQAIQALTQPNIASEERERRARDLLRENFAIATIGQWVLGRYWRAATPEERDEYLKLFESLIIVTYVDRFSRYAGERLEVIGARPIEGGKDELVETRIVRAGGNPVQVGWRVRNEDGRWQIVDVFVEGVSMGQTQRSEFASVIQNRGGTVAALLEEMRKRVKGSA
ncbi:MAG: ABC transporter substrate-binding protein [Rhodospirillales bacterium]|nr:ABC transporter substrate-binding protein [Rhodospirillales bacterium]